VPAELLCCTYRRLSGRQFMARVKIVLKRTSTAALRSSSWPAGYSIPFSLVGQHLVQISFTCGFTCHSHTRLGWSICRHRALLHTCQCGLGLGKCTFDILALGLLVFHRALVGLNSGGDSGGILICGLL